MIILIWIEREKNNKFFGKMKNFKLLDDRKHIKTY